jgi:hypothetical protein
MTVTPFEQNTEKAKPVTTAANDGLNAYRSHPWMPPDVTAAKPNVVENGQLVIPPVPGSDTATKTTPATDPTLAALSLNTPTEATTATPAAKANPNAIDPSYMAAITDQGKLGDPGDMVPMWMRLAPHQLNPLIQQNYGESALNGFHYGVKVPGVDAPTEGQADDGTDTTTAANTVVEQADKGISAV